MVKSVRNCAEGIILLIVFAAATYSQHDAIFEWLRVHTAPPLPPAVEYRDAPSAVVSEPPASATSDPLTSATSDPPTSVILSESQASEGSQTFTDPSAPAVSQNDMDAEIVSVPEPALPLSYNLAIPFTPQAPNEQWGEPYKEACEEASLFMVHQYYQGMREGRISADEADKEIKNIVAFEMELFGAYEDTTTEQTGTLAEMMYGYERVETIDNPTVEQIKAHVAAGHPVIVPAAGRLLGNPYFTAPGPLYHMLVVRGYTQDGRFITNDPGTKRGEAYLYDFDTLMNAMHDWNDGGEITKGKKVVLVIFPNS
ncbi:hypothetical protein FJZ23_00545 [Candidatus Parcubacteria bacterium]|nr:hypothetical protein [Candidatus Parcubacteria bacterium]